jgi:hypothetical protein
LLFTTSQQGAEFRSFTRFNEVPSVPSFPSLEAPTQPPGGTSARSPQPASCPENQKRVRVIFAQHQADHQAYYDVVLIIELIVKRTNKPRQANNVVKKRENRSQRHVLKDSGLKETDFIA